MSTPGVPSTPVTLHLLSLKIPVTAFLKHLLRLSPPPLLAAQVTTWIHPPKSIDMNPIATEHWDILLVSEGMKTLPSVVTENVCVTWSITAKVPTEIVEGFAVRNARMLRVNPTDELPIPRNGSQQRTSQGAVTLSLSPELETWSRSFMASPDGSKPVTMLNLLAYASKEKYLKYIKAFSEGAGANYGGAAKMIGEVMTSNPEHEGRGDVVDEWDDIALVQYPSLEHFVEMVKSEGYQEADRRWKVGALKDTGLLCVVEIDLATQREQL